MGWFAGAWGSSCATEVWSHVPCSWKSFWCLHLFLALLGQWDFGVRLVLGVLTESLLHQRNLKVCGIYLCDLPCQQMGVILRERPSLRTSFAHYLCSYWYSWGSFPGGGPGFKVLVVLSTCDILVGYGDKSGQSLWRAAVQNHTIRGTYSTLVARVSSNLTLVYGCSQSLTFGIGWGQGGHTAPLHCCCCCWGLPRWLIFCSWWNPLWRLGCWGRQLVHWRGLLFFSFKVQEDYFGKMVLVGKGAH